MLPSNVSSLRLSSLRARWRRLGLGLTVFLAGLSLACGGSSRSSGTAATTLSGAVVERAEGFSERPGWADQSHPFSRKEDTLRVTGYVAIGGEQRLEAGYRAADSYARAELVRFLGTRIVAVLEDKLDSEGTQKLSERITEEASLWVEDLPVASRYWEKREDDGVGRLHVWSRIDLDGTHLARLTERVAAETKGLPVATTALLGNLEQSWDTIADPSAYSAEPRLPKGAFRPDWAKDGDSESSEGFEFVCHGVASDEGTAKALAASQCSEKLCRLFGVQITAKTEVREDLEGMSATSEVTERCPEVRAVGRKTNYHTGECGPNGCVFWIRQSYPRAAYEEEKQRLEQPTIIRQQIVVQEGNVVYRDPAECQRQLDAFSKAKGSAVSTLDQRLDQIRRARKACEGIDARESGLYDILTGSLEKGLAGLASEIPPGSYGAPNAYYFLRPPDKWSETVATRRFLDERLALTEKHLLDALLPLRLEEAYAAKDVPLAKITELRRPLLRYPFTPEPVFPTHRASPHLVHATRRGVPLDADFRAYLLEQARAREYSCSNGGPFFGAFSGKTIVELLGGDGSIDAAEWEVARTFMKRDPDSATSCLRVVLGIDKSSAARRKRLTETLERVEKGELSFEMNMHSKRSKLGSLGALVGLDSPPLGEQLALLREWAARLPGPAETGKEIAKRLLDDTIRGGSKDTRSKATRCGETVDTYEVLTTLLPGVDPETFDFHSMCTCLEPDGELGGERRRKLITSLAATSYNDCRAVTDEEWPGGTGPAAKRPEPPPRATEPKARNYESRAGTPAYPWDAAKVLSGSIKKCLMDTSVSHPSNGVLSAWVTIETDGGPKGFRDVRARATVRSKPRDLRAKRGKNGHRWATVDDVRQVEREVTECLETSISSLVPPKESDLGKSATSRRMWLLFSSEDIVEVRYLP